MPLPATYGAISAPSAFDDVVARRKEAVVALVRRERHQEVTTQPFEMPACRTRSSRRRPARRLGSSVEAPRGPRAGLRGSRPCTRRLCVGSVMASECTRDARARRLRRSGSRRSCRHVRPPLLARPLDVTRRGPSDRRRSGGMRVARLAIRRPSTRRAACRSARSARVELLTRRGTPHRDDLDPTLEATTTAHLQYYIVTDAGPWALWLSCDRGRARRAREAALHDLQPPFDDADLTDTATPARRADVVGRSENHRTLH